MSEAPIATALLGFAPGAFGGFCNVFVGHPIDLVKVRMQTSSVAMQSSTLPMLRNILYSQGLAGLYVGVSAPLVAVVPGFAVCFASFDLVSHYILEYNNNNNNNATTIATIPIVNNGTVLTIPETAFAGAVSGIATAVILGPLERIKCLMQVNTTGRYKNMSDCVSQIYRAGGIRSLYKGTTLTVIRDVPGNAAYFGTYQVIKQYGSAFNTNSSSTTTIPPMLITLVAGGMAGVVNWLVAIPMDVIKSKWQTQPDYVTTTTIGGNNNNISNVQQQPVFKHWTSMTRHLLRTEGPTALVRGLGPALLRAFPANAACLLGVETMRKIIGGDYTNNA